MNRDSDPDFASEPAAKIELRTEPLHDGWWDRLTGWIDRNQPTSHIALLFAAVAIVVPLIFASFPDGPRRVCGGPLPGGGSWAQYSVPVRKLTAAENAEHEQLVKKVRADRNSVYVPVVTVDSVYTASQARAAVAVHQQQREDISPHIKLLEEFIERDALLGKREYQTRYSDRSDSFRERLAGEIRSRGFKVEISKDAFGPLFAVTW